MKSPIFFLLLFFVLQNCANTDQAQNTIKDALITKMHQSESLEIAKNQKQQLIVLKNEYCENFDCESYFKGYEDEVIFFDREDIFMRNIRKFIKISEINEGEKYIDLVLITDWEGRGRRIRL